MERSQVGRLFRNSIRSKQLRNMFYQIRKRGAVKSYSFGKLDQRVGSQIEPYVHQLIQNVFGYFYSQQYQQNREEWRAATRRWGFSAVSNCLDKYLLNNKQFYEIKLKNLQSSFLSSATFPELKPIGEMLEILIELQLENLSTASANIIGKIMNKIMIICVSNQTNYHLLPVKLLLNICKVITSLLQNPNNFKILIRKFQNSRFLEQSFTHLILQYQNLTVFDQKVLLKFITEIMKPNKDINVFETKKKKKESYEFLIRYCLIFIRIGFNENMYDSLCAFNNLLYQSPDLIKTLEVADIVKTMKLIQNENRQLATKALQILYVIVYNNQQIADHLVICNDAITEIENRLGKEVSIEKGDMYREEIIERCVDILCEMTLSQNSRVREVICCHSIWGNLLQNLNENSVYLVSVKAFTNFFICHDTKISLQLLPQYFQKLCSLDLTNEKNPKIGLIKNEIEQLRQKMSNKIREDEYFQFIYIMLEFNLID